MRTLCFLWLIIFPTLFAESFNYEKRDVSTTIQLLHELGPKICLKEVENATSDRFKRLHIKRHEIQEALKISYDSIFELLKKNVTNCEWDNNAFQKLMDHLNRQTKKKHVAVSYEPEKLVENFKLLDGFLTQKNFTRCACEIARQDLHVVMDHLRRILGLQRKRHN